MLQTFWEGLGSKVAESWATALVGPAFVFWAGGLLAWVTHFGAGDVAEKFLELEGPLKIALILAVPAIVFLTTALQQPLIPAALRLLEGYWPDWCSIRVLLTTRQSNAIGQAAAGWQALRLKGLDKLTDHEMQDYVRYDRAVKLAPAEGERMPTRLGNILRSAERRPTAKYGLDGVICWPRLWMLLPEAAKNDLSTSRSTLDSAVRTWMLSVLFMFWAAVSFVPGSFANTWTLWPLPAGFVAALLAYRWGLSAAEVYGDLIEAAYDLYRFALYEALRWPLPAMTSNELLSGRQLTEYLLRGTVSPAVTFSLSKSPDPVAKA